MLYIFAYILFGLVFITSIDECRMQTLPHGLIVWCNKAVDIQSCPVAPCTKNAEHAQLILQMSRGKDLSDFERGFIVGSWMVTMFQYRKSD